MEMRNGDPTDMEKWEHMKNHGDGGDSEHELQ